MKQRMSRDRSEKGGYIQSTEFPIHVRARETTSEILKEVGTKFPALRLRTWIFQRRVEEARTDRCLRNEIIMNVFIVLGDHVCAARFRRTWISSVLGSSWEIPEERRRMRGSTIFFLAVLHVLRSSITIRSQFVSGFGGISAAPRPPERKWDAQVPSAPPPESAKVRARPPNFEMDKPQGGRVTTCSVAALPPPPLL
ncbi:hypothetical protein TSAR_014494 [Trichomalopsis sarcophagae]|uniref:Uncharacterized protein n=1 Tax=Trichomalopsis sarcophagae TaxID=543379 RepID=A0A232F8M3_9HYME|nr:hypothetical protein TSAR_014494 [Trichomalopsis sarcophagae]